PGDFQINGNGVTLGLIGGSIDASNVNLNGGVISGHGDIDAVIRDVSVINASAAGILALGDNSVNAVNLTGLLNVDAGEVVLNSSGFTNLGSLTVLNGGTLRAGGVALGQGDNLVGGGTVAARISADTGSIVTATGNLTLGDASSLSGFFSDGELYADSHTVTILDQDVAVLGSLTSLGDAQGPGELTAPNGLILENGKSLAGTGTINNAFNNQGHVVGPTSPDKLDFTGNVKGIGDFDGNVVYSGTFSPGNSPGRVQVNGNATFLTNSVFEIELTGLQPGLEHDRVDVSGTATLAGTLDVQLPGGYVPQLGDQFEILTFGNRVGDFDNYTGLAIGGGLQLQSSLDGSRLILTTVSNNDTVSPTVVSIGINTDQVDPADLPSRPQPTSWQQQHSDIRSLVVQFDEPINATTADIRLTNLGVNAPLDADSSFAVAPSHLSVSGDTLTLSFAPSELSDGIYQLEVLGTLTDLAGNPVDGNGDGTGGDPHVLRGNSTNKFYKLAADWNGDTGVSVFDFGSFSYWFGIAVPTAPAYMDVNLDGGVSVFDFSTFSNQFGIGIVNPLPFTGLAARRIATVDGHSEQSIDRQADEVKPQHASAVDWLFAMRDLPRKDAMAENERRGIVARKSETKDSHDLEGVLDQLFMDF
ncbi:MAG: hypothetical protein ACI9G1_003381, partial [Pirellulaceae bacterium]